MRACIHRGASQIGGSCIELESGGKRLLLDLGLPLDAAPGDPGLLPPVKGLVSGSDPDLLGVVVSHPHQDHWGLLGEVPRPPPVFIGEAAASILRAASFFGSAGIELEPKGFLRHRERFEVGPFAITPFLNDHSAYDAYAVMVEADGQRLFYPGDIRGHGRKAPIFEQLLRDPPVGIDVLLMEGTNIPSSDAAEKTTVTERALERNLVDDFRGHDGIVLVAFSAQNIDRLVTVYRAALQAGRELVVDLYAASIAEATGRKSIPKPGFRKLRVFLPHSQRLRIKKTQAFDRTDRVKPYRIYPEELQERQRQLVMLFRASMIADLERAACLDSALMLWSLWPGYLRDARQKTKLDGFLARHNVKMEIRHTSGHASVEDLGRLVATLGPSRVVPVHTFAPDRFDTHFPSVERHDDATWWAV